MLVALAIPSIDPLMGIMPGLKAFVAAVLGGIGNIPGAVLGGLLIGRDRDAGRGYAARTYRDAIAFVILILILLLPAGRPARRGHGWRGVMAGAIALSPAALVWLAALRCISVGVRRASPRASTAYYLRHRRSASGSTSSLAVCLNLINGFTGQFSIGHAGFMAIGALRRRPT